jgi:nitroimidazol reductase NimA-like FMN-containing flavoprotein (pyridoxamine 5'-phosphate oxidase superfamily)
MHEGPGLDVLDRAECLRLLADARFGRLAVRMHDGTPMIRPVNFAFDHHSQSVVFRTARGSKLHRLLMDGPAAFEIDGVDMRRRSGWSVIVSGVTEEVHSPAEIDRLLALGVLPWAPEQKPFFVRLRAFTVSGRRLQAAPDAVAE